MTATTRGCCLTTYLQLGGSALDEAADDLLHPLWVPHVDRGLLELRHLDGDTADARFSQ